MRSAVPCLPNRSARNLNNAQRRGDVSRVTASISRACFWRMSVSGFPPQEVKMRSRIAVCLILLAIQAWNGASAAEPPLPAM